MHIIMMQCPRPDGSDCGVQQHPTGGGGGGWHKASVLGYLPLAVPIGLLPLLNLTLCGSERVLVVSTEPLDDLSCLTTPGSAVLEPWGGGGAHNLDVWGWW